MRPIDDSGGTGPLVSVVIPIRNGEDYVSDLVQGLEAQTLPPDRFEVVVVDDGSVDDTASLLASWVAKSPDRRRLVSGEGKGPARARNLGVAEARGEWVAFTDADTLPQPDWLEAALGALEHTGAQALEGGIEAWPPAAIGPHTHQIANMDSPGRYMTANMVYRRTLLEAVGGFDERFGQAFLEDSDLAFRVKDLGHEIAFAPEALVRHRVLPGGLKSNLKATRQLRWLALLAAKHPDRYQDEVGRLLRPLSANDIDVLLALIASSALPGARGYARLALAACAANGVRRAVGSGKVLSGPRREIPMRATLALTRPPMKAWWWLEGCFRFRNWTW